MGDDWYYRGKDNNYYYSNTKYDWDYPSSTRYSYDYFKYLESELSNSIFNSKEYRANKEIEKMIRNILGSIDPKHSRIIYNSNDATGFATNHLGQYSHVLRDSESDRLLYLEYNIDDQVLKSSLGQCGISTIKSQFLFIIASNGQ